MRHSALLKEIELAFKHLEEAELMMDEAEDRVANMRADIAYMENEYDRLINAVSKEDLL